MVQFEYKRMHSPLYSSISDDQLAKIGDDGWELVSVVTLTNDNFCYYFKRAKESTKQTLYPFENRDY